MGRLTFTAGIRADFDERTFAHVHHVIIAKLRRGESFHLSWRDDDATGDGRTTIWLNPRTSFVSKFVGGAVELNPLWLEALMVSANSATGLIVVPEPDRAASHGGG